MGDLRWFGITINSCKYVRSHCEFEIVNHGDWFFIALVSHLLASNQLNSNNNNQLSEIKAADKAGCALLQQWQFDCVFIGSFSCQTAWQSLWICIVYCPTRPYLHEKRALISIENPFHWQTEWKKEKTDCKQLLWDLPLVHANSALDELKWLRALLSWKRRNQTSPKSVHFQEQLPIC